MILKLWRHTIEVIIFQCWLQIGWVLSCFALAAFLKGSGGIATFAVLYTIGNIVCIIG